jgi:hypothetical protein
VAAGDTAGLAGDTTGLTGAAGKAFRSASLKVKFGWPPPDLPEGCVSRLQRWALSRPAADSGRDLDAG